MIGSVRHHIIVAVPLVLMAGGCAQPLPFSSDRTDGLGSTLVVESAPSPISTLGRIPDRTAGSTWSYDVIERTRRRPQDESEPWSPWEMRQIRREAVGLREQVLDGRMYVVLQETDHRSGAPPDPSPPTPHRRDQTGLYYRPVQVVGVSANGAEDPVPERRGGPVGRDDLLVPHPARPNEEFVSNRFVNEIRVVEAREAIRTGMGVIPAVRIRVLARDTARPGDSIVEWYTLQGRVASHTNSVRVTFGPNRNPYWTEVDRTEILRQIAP